jgi:hypothetical protein
MIEAQLCDGYTFIVQAAGLIFLPWIDTKTFMVLSPKRAPLTFSQSKNGRKEFVNTHPDLYLTRSCEILFN